MTAIGAAIIELKAHCEHTWEIIRALERFAAVVEEAHGPAPTVTPSVAHTPTVVAKIVQTPRPTPRATRPQKADGRPAKAPATPATNGRAAAAFSTGADILRVLGTRQEPLSPKDIIRLTKLPRWKVMKTLLALAQAGSLVRVWHHRGARYQLASTPRPGATAGTSSVLTAGSSPANGSTTAPAGFEVAWNGTKERNGDAPTILPPRERRP